MTAIDMHFHVVPPTFVEALRRGDLAAIVESEALKDRERLTFRAPPGIVVEPDISLRPHQYDARMLMNAMSSRRLDAAAVSSPPELFLYWATPELGARIARTMNDGMAQLARAHPDRFMPLATLPMQDPLLAARELEYAITSAGLYGAAVCTHVCGIVLDDAIFAPVFACAERLGVPIFLHPQNTGDISRMEDFHLWNVIGFPLETVVAGSRLIASGLFERHPRLNVVLAHGGGFFPYQLGRLDHAYRVRPSAFKGLPKPPSAYLENIYCDSLTHDGTALRFLIDCMGFDHVVLGTDYPFSMACDTPVEVVESLALPARQSAAVIGGTLSRLLGRRS